MGRSRKITDEVVTKLEYAFCKGFNITEACDYAEISRETYYNYLEKNKSFSDKMKRAQTALTRRAKLNLAECIESGDLAESKYYLERKCKDEFSTKQEIQHSGNMSFRNPMSDLTTEELRKLIDDG